MECQFSDRYEFSYLLIIDNNAAPQLVKENIAIFIKRHQCLMHKYCGFIISLFRSKPVKNDLLLANM